jgi:hypothetical protein
MKPALAFLLFLSLPLAAQIRLGVKGGMPLTDVTEAIGNSTLFDNVPYRWTLGPMVELDLPAGLGVEFNALYRKVGYEAFPSAANPVKNTGSLWDFPLIAKYKFKGTLARPYIGAGYTYRRISDILDPLSSQNGFVVSGGVRINVLFLKISPEFRYTRWNTPDVQPAFRTSNNQAEILVGLTF